MFEFGDSADNVIFDGFGEGHIVRRKDQVHVSHDATGVGQNPVKV
jgi:hypothetical protein